ncbi:MAG: ATP-binding protein [Rhodospirillaceae bacterium]
MQVQPYSIGTPQVVANGNVLADEISRELFDRAAIGMALAEVATRRFLWVNRKLCEITGYTKEELLQRTAVDLTHPDDREMDRVTFAQYLRGEIDQRIVEKRYIRKDGSVVWVRITTSIVNIRGRQCSYGVTEDISDRRRAELELREADRRKDEFLAMLAHELRNPLAAIRNSVEVMRASCGGDQQMGRVQEIVDRQSQHLARLIDDLLDVARVATGKVALRKQRLAVADIAACALERVRPLVVAREQELVTRIPAEPIHVLGDELRLIQIVDNLLNNAAKYTHNKGRIELAVERSGGEICIRVSDTGVGIAADVLPHVFGLFKQADGSLARTSGGLGIGLTIVKDLVDMHGGRISVHSVVNEGSVFEVRLPEAPAPVLPKSKEGAENVDPMHILIVEDNEDAAESLALLLELGGHAVHTAPDGMSALNMLEHRTPDAILVDIGLPGMSGYEFAQKVRESDRAGRTLLVAISGYGSAEDKAKSAQAGFDAHLVKPVDFRALATLLASHSESGTPGRGSGNAIASF